MLAISAFNHGPFFLIPVALLLLWNTSLLNATDNPLSAKIFGSESIIVACAFVIFFFQIFVVNLSHNTILMAIFSAFILLCLAQYLCIFFGIIKPKKILFSNIRQQKVEKHISTFYLKSGISLMINSISYIAMRLVAMLMIEWMSPNEAALGQYVIITKISAIFGVLSHSISFLMKPHYSGLNDTHRLNGLQRIINLQLITGLIWLATCITLILMFRDVIFKAYSINFDHATFAIILSLVGSYCFRVADVSEMICLYNNMNKTIYPISFLELVIIAVSCYILIPRYSFLGAIYAKFLAEIVCHIICWFIVRFRGIKVKIFGFI